jgi:Polysaccharide lyase
MKVRTTRLLGGSIILALLLACGDGGGGKSDGGSTDTTVKTSSVSLSTPGGTPCASGFNDSDAFGNIRFQPSTGTTPWGCLVVDLAGNQPTVSGTKSVRVELRPGDCDSSQTFLSGSAVVSDCTSDRSRFEIRQVVGGSTAGQIITYEYYVYIPAQANFQPSWNKTGSAPLTVLTQINWQCGATPCPSLGGNGYGALAYLVIDSAGTLFVQTHQDFTWAQNAKVPVDGSPFDKWIKLKYVIKSSSAGDGFFQAYANDKLIVNEARVTLPNPSAFISLKLGIYNSSISSVSKPWSTQLIYYDALSTSVQNF